MKKGWGTYTCGYMERNNSLSKKILDDAQNAVRQEYDKLVKEGRLPEGQFDTFYAGYGLALLEKNT